MLQSGTNQDPRAINSGEEQLKKQKHECAGNFVHNFDKPLLGIIHGASVVVPQDSPSADLLYTFVDVHNLSATGALIESSREIGLNSLLDFMAYDFSQKKWNLHAAQVASVEEHTTHGHLPLGLIGV